MAYYPRYPDKGANNFYRVCIKLHGGCCHPPKNRVDSAGRQGRTSAFLHPLLWTGATVLRRLSPLKTEDNSCPSPWLYCGNPFPKLMRGRRTLHYKRRGGCPLERIPISELLARLNWFFYLWPARAL
jgi:hypothetical protein